MTETSEGETKESGREFRLSRRGFLKAAGALIGTGVVSHEIIKGNSGVRTDVGVFVPLYERHGLRIDPKDIPRDTNCYFREYSDSTLMSTSTRGILETTGGAYRNTPLEIHNFRVFPEETLKTLSKIGAEIMVGDVSISSLVMEQLQEALPRTYLAVGLLGSVLEAVKEIPKIPRRRLLKWLGRASLLWSSPIFTNALRYSPLGKEQDAAKRIIARIDGIISDFHPEDVSVFFRNAVMAIKMLNVASEMKDSSGGRLPKFVFQVERGHAGIEDFLQIGTDSCRNLILAYPKSFLKEVVSINGGVENFCTARLFKLPKDFRTVSGRIPDDVVRLITERRVVDTKLKERLEKVLSG